MAPTKQPCAKYQYVVTPAGPKILPVPDPVNNDEENPADYNPGGYLPVSLGDHFSDGRYTVIRKLGWGHFSTVWLVKDNKLKRHSALKVVKCAGRYSETARDEIKLLTQIAEASPSHPGRKHIVSFLDSFTHPLPPAPNPHVCIVFEPLGENLLALIERNRKKGVPRHLVRVISKQLLQGLAYLHDECRLVHTDIKPENILISIPDIEAHIEAELSLCPTPTSRRVGVPLPNTAQNRSRLSTNASNAERRARTAQVQIFDSQPLGSPRSRSGGSSVPTIRALQKSPMPLPIPTALTGTPVPMSVPTANTTSPAASTSTSASSSSLPISTPATSVSHGSALGGKLAFTHGERISTGLQTYHVATVTIPMAVPHSHTISHVKAVSTPSSAAVGEDRYSESWRHSIVSSLRGTYSNLGPNDEDGSSQPSSWKPSNSFKPSPPFHPSSPPPPSSSWKGVPPSIALAENKRSSISGTRENRPLSAFWNVGGKGSSSPAPAPASLLARIATPSPAVAVTVYASASTVSKSTSPDKLSTPTSPLTTTIIDLDPSLEQTQHPHKDSLTPVPVLGSGPSLLTQTAPGALSLSIANNKHMRNTSNSVIKHKASSARIHTPPIRINTNGQQPSSSIPTKSSPHMTAPPPTPSSPTAPSITEPTETQTQHKRDNTIIPAQPDDSLVNPPQVPLFSIKIADLGNATPVDKHFTEDIQTRQYRAPEAILGRRDWGACVDIWSVACVIFELLTGEYLFDPQGQGELFTKDDDHMAQIIELMGDFSMEVKMGGKYSRELFDSTGALRYIRTLKPWPLHRVMTEKYLNTAEDAQKLCSFLEPMLRVNMRERALARDMVDHAWLDPVEGEDDGWEDAAMV